MAGRMYLWLIALLAAASPAWAEIKLVNANPLADEFEIDVAAAKPAGTMTIAATRNGSFSGEVVLISDQPFEQVSGRVSEFVAVAGKGRIPASAVQVRFAFTAESGSEPWHYLDRLNPDPPKQVPVVTAKMLGGAWQAKAAAVGKAILPTWVTVRIPRDAPAGEYKATLSLSAGGQDFAVPVLLSVAGWSLPDPKDYRMFVELIQSPETVAMQYQVPLWSDQHFRLMAKSMELMGQVGNKTLYVPLICQTNQGNEQTMVRWVRDQKSEVRGQKSEVGGRSTWGYDFGQLEKYLDVYEKSAGKPQFVILYVWDAFLAGGTGKGGGGEEVLAHEPAETREGRLAEADKGPQVTVLADGEVRSEYLTQYGAAGSREQWRGLLAGVQDRLKKRGVDKGMCLGVVTDVQPDKSVVDFFKDLLPGTPWMRRGHMRIANVSGQGLCLQESPSYNSWAYDTPADKKVPGWKGTLRPQLPGLAVHFPRGDRDHASRCQFRNIGEVNIAGTQCGFGGWGADFWRVLKDRRGNVTGRLAARYPKSSWRNLDIHTVLTAPGPDGALATARYEMMREGIQECEARIFIEEALLDPQRRAKLGGNLARKCQALLDERVRALTDTMGKDWAYSGTTWVTRRQEYDAFIASAWQQRSRQLFEMAAEVAGALK